MNILAYHITWGTYGTRLHGDPRGTVDRDHNEPGTPVLGYDQHRWEQEKANLNFPPVVLTREQMRTIESLIPGICERGFWKYITCAAGPDHVHVILQSQHNLETIRRLIKRWLGQELTQRYKHEPGCPQPGTKQTWWAECGSIKYIDNDRYLNNATKYVTDQRGDSGDMTITGTIQVFASELKPSVFKQLGRIHTPGLHKAHFECQLPIGDRAFVECLQVLKEASLHPWENTSRPREKFREFLFVQKREYSSAEMSRFALLEPLHDGYLGTYRRPSDRLLCIDADDLRQLVKGARTGRFGDWVRALDGATVVSDSTLEALQRSKPRHAQAQPTLLMRKFDNDAESLTSESWRNMWPWWEMWSDVVLPPLSPTMDLRDRNGKRVHPGDPAVCVRREGLYAHAELHYRASDLQKLPRFDLAGTNERFGGGAVAYERTLVCSQRFRKACLKAKLRIAFAPVHIDDA